MDISLHYKHYNGRNQRSQGNKHCMTVRYWHFSRVLLLLYAYFVHNTVQIFNYCTSRPDVCQYVVVKTPMDNMSRKCAKHMNDPRCL